jgi:hypothetical protein
VDEDLEALVRTLWIREPLEDRVAEDLEVDDVQRDAVDDGCPGDHHQLRNSGATAPTSNAKTTPNAIESEMWTIAPVADERADG